MAVAKAKVGLVLALVVGLVAAGAGVVGHQVLGGKQEAGPAPVAKEVQRVTADGEKQRSRTDLYGDPLPPGALGRFGTVRFRHGGWLDRLTFSSDGTRSPTLVPIFACGKLPAAGRSACSPNVRTPWLSSTAAGKS